MATLGGCIAAGLSGPRRMYAGAARDLVLGIRLMNGEGTDLQFGGRVMKNVAGFDVSRVIAGSLGTLGVILEASLKVVPRPAMERTMALELPERRAIETMNRWAALPLPVSGTAYFDNRLHVRLSGAAPAVDAALRKLGGDAMNDEDARSLWEGLREHTHAYFRSDEPLWRLAVPSATAPLELPGRTLIEWGGGLRWVRGSVSASSAREAAVRSGGHATLFRNGDKAVGVFQPLTPALLALHRRLKHALDPAGIFNRGRLYPDF
jgi:glycolate oxidase FAD binding subunit